MSPVSPVFHTVVTVSIGLKKVRASINSSNCQIIWENKTDRGPIPDQGT